MDDSANQAHGDTNLVLIGMPGSGKSTIGIILAKEVARDFVDTDVVIQLHEKTSLQHILEQTSYINLRNIEERVLCSLTCVNSVIATGGSAAYSHRAMMSLKRGGIVIFLDVAFAELCNRINNFSSRGIAMRSDQSFHDLFLERVPLYKKYADIIIDCTNLSQEEIARRIAAQTAAPTNSNNT